MLQDKLSPPTLQEMGIHTLRAGVDANYPPIVFKKDGAIRGIEADLAERLENRLGVDIQFVEMPFSELIAALNTGKIDLVMSGMSATERRQSLVRFVTPYMTIGQVAIVRAADKDRFDKPKEALYVNGLRVGCESRTTGMTFAANNMLLAEIIQYDSVAAGLDGLRKGEVAVFIHDSPTAWRIAADAEDSDLAVLTAPLTEEPLAWAVRNEDEDLFRNLDRAMRALKKEGKIKAVVSKWVPSSVSMTIPENQY